MTTTLTIEREVHFQAQPRGRKGLRAGPAPQGPAAGAGPRAARGAADGAGASASRGC